MKTKRIGLKKAMPSFIAILIGLVVGVAIIFFTNPSAAGEAIPNFFMGPFMNGMAGIGNLFYYATPLLMTGLAVGFAFKTGLFNIGASGQFLLGGFMVILLCNRLERFVPPFLMWPAALLVSALAGAFLGAIVGALKAYRNVNEVITCIMLNYTVMYLINDLIKRLNIYNLFRNTTVAVSTSIPRMGFDVLFPGTFAGGGFLIGLVMVVCLHLILKKTTFGFEMKAVGLNRDAAKYAGVNERASIIKSMAISGAMAGLGGGLFYLSGAGTAIAVVDVLPQEGFDGIAVALLGLSEPIGILLSALFFSYLSIGGQAIQTLGYAPELITIIISFILYVSALSVLFRRLLNRRKKDDIETGVPLSKEPPKPAIPKEEADTSLETLQQTPMAEDRTDSTEKQLRSVSEILEEEGGKPWNS